MSGIDNIKKKAKMSIDEMYDNQMVGKLDTQQNGLTENKPVDWQTIKPSLHIDVQPDGNKHNSTDNHTTNQPETHKPGYMEIQHEIKHEHQMAKSSTIYRTVNQQKKPTYKVTFNLTEDIYKSFNDLYANRILQGRKTDKSEMICEAIQWLIKMEEQIK